MLIDAHTHIDRYDLVGKDAVKSALEEITRHRIFTISNSIDLPSYRRNLAIGEMCDLVLPTFGVHPWNAPQYVQRLEALSEAIAQSPMLGEIGLDHYFVKDTSYCARRSLPGSGGHIRESWRSSGRMFVANYPPGGAPAMADLAYREVYTMNQVQARKLLVRTYQETGNISETARRWHTSRQVVRKWVRRFQEEGEKGLRDRSRRPHHCPHQTPPEIEEQVLQARQATNYGRERLALYLQRQGISISPHTIRHILRRQGITGHKRHQRKPLYPAHWVWDEDVPFALIQADVKDILDKRALGTTLWQHMRKHHLPRYQWTACDGRTRLRFLAYSHRNNRTNGLAFLLLVLHWNEYHECGYYSHHCDHRLQ